MKTLNILWCVFAWLFVSCYEDLGSYDYKSLEPIKILSGIQEDYRCYAASDTLKIFPELSKPEEAQDYCWYYYKEETSGKRTMDTLSREKNLIFPVRLPAGIYQFFYRVRNAEGFAVYTRFKLTVITEFTEGWFVLKEEEAMTDVDLFRFDSVVFRNTIQAINGTALKGKAVALSYADKYDYMDSVRKFARSLFVVSENDMNVVRIEDMNVICRYEDLFYAKPEVCRLQNWKTSRGGYALTNDGQLSTISMMTSNIGKFGLPQEGNFRINPYSAMGAVGSIIFDDLSSSFYALAFGASSPAIFKDIADKPSPRNLNSDLIFLGRSKTALGEGRAFLRKRAEVDTLLVMKMTLTLPDPSKVYPITSIDTVTGFIEPILFPKADCFALNKEYEYLYFNDKHRWMRYDIDNKREEEVYLFPENEQITFMKHIIYDNKQDVERSLNIFLVATHSGGHYKVYRFKLLSGRPLNGKYEGEPLEGSGVVREVQYLVPKMGRFNTDLVL